MNYGFGDFLIAMESLAENREREVKDAAFAARMGYHADGNTFSGFMRK
ncbi:MAG: hypothetical protein RBT11_01625 [Desulfobacterales bacterium]|jgi:hypothetical protein|nr:hypothetical protein [Desulfobacterales bacterium]